MAEKPEKPNIPPREGEDKVEVPLKVLTDLQEKMLRMEKDREEDKGKIASLEEIANAAEPVGEKKLREKKSFEPAFRTVRLRRYPIAGDVTDLGYVVGWSNRGAYQEVDRSGISPQFVDYIEVAFLGKERSKEGKLSYEKIRLLDLLNKGEQVHCKILERTTENVVVETGEEINVSIWDPQHGLVQTGDVIDGYTTHSEIRLKLQIPGVSEPAWVDATYCN